MEVKKLLQIEAKPIPLRLQFARKDIQSGIQRTLSALQACRLGESMLSF